MPHRDGYSIGLQLGLKRRQRRLSIRGLAKLSRLSKGLIQNLEHGRCKATWKTVQILAAGLHCDSRELCKPLELTPQDIERATKLLPAGMVERLKPMIARRLIQTGHAVDISKPTLMRGRHVTSVRA